MGPPQTERPVLQLTEEEQSKFDDSVQRMQVQKMQIVQVLTNVFTNYSLIQLDIASVMFPLWIAIGFDVNNFVILINSSTIS